MLPCHSPSTSTPCGSGGCAGWKPNPSLYAYGSGGGRLETKPQPYASWFRRVCRLETKPQPVKLSTLCHLYSEALLQLGSQRHPRLLFLRLGPLHLRCFSSLLLPPLHHTTLDDSLSPTPPSSVTSLPANSTPPLHPLPGQAGGQSSLPPFFFFVVFFPSHPVQRGPQHGA